MKPGWQVRPLGEVVTIKPPKREAQSRVSPEQGVSFVPMEDLKGLQRDFRPRQTRALAEVYGGYTYFADGDVLLAKITPCFENGKLSVAKELENGVGFGSSEFMVLRCHDRLDPEFLFYFLSRDEFRESGKARMTGAVGHKRVPPEYVQAIPIPLPPLDEQRRIVAVLDDAFEGLSRARANTEANLADARELFASQIEDLIMRSGGIEVPLEELIEEGAILSHFDGNHGENYPRKEEFVSEGVPYLSANCIVGNDVDFTRAKFLPEERADTLRKGTSVDRDVLFAHNATVGPVALLRTDLPRVLLSTSLTHYRCNETALLPEFLLAEMQSSAFVRQYQAVMRQATRNQVPISAQRKLTHIIPPMEAQQRIAEVSTQLKDEVDRLVGIVEQSAHDLDTLRQSLLQRAFAGELT